MLGRPKEDPRSFALPLKEQIMLSIGMMMMGVGEIWPNSLDDRSWEVTIFGLKGTGHRRGFPDCTRGAKRHSQALDAL